ncbi:hypothetical protein [Dactylosporangium salmoneum]|uniref:Ankyrin repeat domain-containing protein n=1 Tax=Dactylosporangium salmoneum TaxID=53361 RepID=A0ABP5UAQ2_9ACTN
MEDAGSIPAGLPFLERDLPQWRRIRAGMPGPELVAAAADRRAAGDWRGAAALLPVSVDVDLAAVRARYGAEAADALEDDLHHLCLDLLWWHLPRHRGGMTTLQAQVTAVLAPPSGADTAPLIRVRLPRSPTGPQRLELDVRGFAELEYERWYLAPRYTWDVRHTDELSSAWISPQVYAMLSAGEHERAWRECGIVIPEGEEIELQRPTAAPTSPVGVAEQARAAGAAFGVRRVATLFGAYINLDLPDLTAEASYPGEWMEVPVRIPTGTVPPDLALLSAGLMTPADLHPLIRSALFGDLSREPVLSDSAPRSGYFRVRCGADWHQLSIAKGALRLHDHNETEQRREAALRSLGGQSGGCYATEAAWRTGGGRLPRALREHRRAVVERLQHGDTPYLLEGLAAGTIDPRMRAGNGWTLLHMVMWLDWEQALGPVLATGLPIDVPDRIGRTPLYVGVINGADPGLLRRLVAAGANPRAATVHGTTPQHIAGRSRDLQFLLEEQ